MKIGVCTTPWFRVSAPRRAWLEGSVLSRSNWSMAGIVGGGHATEARAPLVKGRLANATRAANVLEMSLMGMPASACLRKPMICSSVNLVFFMSVILQRLTDFVPFNWYGLEGAGQAGFTSAGLRFCRGACQQHRIAITEESVLLRNGVAVQAHDVLVASKGAHQHHQCAFGQVKVGDQPIHHLEFKARRDEDLCVTAGLARCGPGFECAHRRGPHRENFATTGLARSNGMLGGLRHLIPLTVHDVFSNVFGFDGLKRTSTDVQCDACALHATRIEFRQQGFIKMQSSSWRGHRTRGFREDGLITL